MKILLHDKCERNADVPSSRDLRRCERRGVPYRDFQSRRREGGRAGTSHGRAQRAQLYLVGPYLQYILQGHALHNANHKHTVHDTHTARPYRT